MSRVSVMSLFFVHILSIDYASERAKVRGIQVRLDHFNLIYNTMETVHKGLGYLVLSYFQNILQSVYFIL